VHYRVTVTYTITCEANDEEQVLDSLLPHLPSDTVLGMPRIVITPLRPQGSLEGGAHARHCDTHLHRENPCTCKEGAPP
jgi:hypothetical protein